MGDIVETQAMDDVAVYELHSGTGDGADMVFAFNGCLISVSIFPSNGLSTQDTQGQEYRPLQDHLIDLIEKATVCQDDDEYEELVDEVFAVILDAGRPLFCQLISSQDQQAQNKFLHYFLFPPFFHFRLEASAPTGSVSIIPISSSETDTIHAVDPASDQDFQEELEICQDLPRYTPEEVFATEVFERGARTVTAAVQIQGRDMFCKSSGEPGGLYGTSKGRELECLHKIRESFPTGSIRVPQLLGYVNNHDTEHILGFLRQWVPGRRLSDIITSATSQNKEKWASQIRQTVELLHQHGLIWGGGKPDSIIIDEQDNAWLIDFGGGYTRGWVDEDLAETKEGDEQALLRVRMQVSDEVLEIRTGNVFHCKRDSPIRKNRFQELSKQHLEGHLVGRQRLRTCARCLDTRAPNGSLTCLQPRSSMSPSEPLLCNLGCLWDHHGPRRILTAQDYLLKS